MSMGHVEVQKIAKQLLVLVKEDSAAAVTTPKLFHKPPLMCWDNYFSGDLVDGKSMLLLYVVVDYI